MLSEGCPKCPKACWAAPKAGVLVVAPQSNPTILDREMPVSGHNATAMSVPRKITPKPHKLKVVPSCRKAPKKFGPTYSPKV